jgi:hypothetical protein
MSAIPLHVQRKLEQRWAARFAPAAPKNNDLKGTVNNLPRPATAEEKPAELSKAGLVGTGMQANGLVYSRKSTMPQSNRDPSTAETGERIPARPHGSGSQSDET